LRTDELKTVVADENRDGSSLTFVGGLGDLEGLDSWHNHFLQRLSVNR
jgi:hypothetical protein